MAPVSPAKPVSKPMLHALLIRSCTTSHQPRHKVITIAPPLSLNCSAHLKALQHYEQPSQLGPPLPQRNDHPPNTSPSTHDTAAAEYASHTTHKFFQRDKLQRRIHQCSSVGSMELGLRNLLHGTHPEGHNETHTPFSFAKLCINSAKASQPVLGMAL